MNHFYFLLFLFLNYFSFSQPKSTTATVFRSADFISKTEAELILDKPVFLKDSSFRNTSGLVRYALDYVAVYKDSTSKGRLFFSFEKYADVISAKDTYQSIKKENEKDVVASIINDTGDEGFIIKDNLQNPFVMIRKNNSIYKFKLYYLTDKHSLDKLMKVAKKIVASH